MASTYAKRLAKLEELMASRLNEPLATLWLNAGETREQVCIRAGYDVSMVDRIRFVRWLTEDEVAAAPPSYTWDQANQPGPPQDDPREDPPAQDPQEEEEYQERIARRLQTEKLFEATKAFAKTIV